MTKAALSQTAVRPRPNLFLPALLLLAALVFAFAQFLVSDPGTDGGSGIGGTGRLGGDSGIGGTGGPVKFGALDTADDREDDDIASTVQAREIAGAPPLASTRIAVESLRLTPVKPTVMAVQSAPAAAREALQATLADIDAAARARASEELETLKTVDIDLRAERNEFASGVRRLIEADLDSTARGVSISSTEVTRELVLVQASLDIATDVPPPMTIDVVAGEEDERRRLAVPVRPERPDRPGVSTPRFTPPQRGVPTPPVRPLRL